MKLALLETAGSKFTKVQKGSKRTLENKGEEADLVVKKPKRPTKDGKSDTADPEKTVRNALRLFFNGTNKVKCPLCETNDIDLLLPAGRDGAHIIPSM